MISYKQIVNQEEKIAVIGLGYVGIPLALSFAKKAKVIGFDIDNTKINNYKNGVDPTKEVGNNAIKETTVFFTSKEKNLKDAKFHIIAVPTPTYSNKLPNLEYIKEASKILGRNLIKGSIIVYESTVYPGVTEEICIPILERESKLKCGPDFKVGYSPERINPSDSINKLETIVKVVSGIDDQTTNTIAEVYKLIIKADIYKAENIKVAEAAKIIENIQRDVNIALINELSIILHKLNIDTKAVIEAASTKWNFMDFKPGLVGGHCIGVDSYFLLYKIQQLGFNPEIISASRKTNDSMPQYIADKAVEKLINSDKEIKGSNIAVFGFSFKENCTDTRNTKVIDIINKLREYKINVKVVDPIVDSKEVIEKYGINIYHSKDIQNMDAIIFAVAHEEFNKLSLVDIKSMYSDNKNPILIDVKSIFNKKEAKALGFNYWRL